jgi:hypothetical protein
LSESVVANAIPPVVAVEVEFADDALEALCVRHGDLFGVDQTNAWTSTSNGSTCLSTALHAHIFLVSAVVLAPPVLVSLLALLRAEIAVFKA